MRACRRVDSRSLCYLAPQSLVISPEFQHILRILNTNIDGRRKVGYCDLLSVTTQSWHARHTRYSLEGGRSCLSTPLLPMQTVQLLLVVQHIRFTRFIAPRYRHTCFGCQHLPRELSPSDTFCIEQQSSFISTCSQVCYKMQVLKDDINIKYYIIQVVSIDGCCVYSPLFDLAYDVTTAAR